MESSFSENRTCPGCNHVVKSTWKICPYCKHKLQENVSRANLRTAEDPRNSEYTVLARNLPKEKRKGKGCIIAVVGVLVVLVIAAVVAKKCFLFDARDGQLYRIVKIGNQTWMAENLNYSIDGSMCYDNDASNCSKYGRLYTWESARTACPSGWHLPSMTDFEKLLATVGYVERDGGKTASIHLRSKNDWTSQEGDDRYGFSVLPAGNYDSYYKEFDFLGKNASFLSSTEDHSGDHYFLLVEYFGVDVNFSGGKDSGFSVRCLQD